MTKTTPDDATASIKANPSIKREQHTRTINTSNNTNAVAMDAAHTPMRRAVREAVKYGF